jgi:hypothetical protein
MCRPARAPILVLVSRGALPVTSVANTGSGGSAWSYTEAVMFRHIGRLLVAGAVLAMTAATSTGLASASPAAVPAGRPAALAGSPGTAGPVPPDRVISLHQAYEKDLTHVRPGKMAGIVYARGKVPKAPRNAAASCVEPSCPVTYNGGAVEHAPKVYLLLWGPGWSSDPSQTATALYLEKFYQGLGVQPQDAWSRTTEQYGDSSGGPWFGGSVYAGAWQDPSPPPGLTNPVQFSAEAEAFALLIGIPDWNDAQVVIATQSGTCPLSFPCPGLPGPACAYHDASLATGGIPYVNLPYQPDATGCWGTEGFTISGGHEYAETITDPFPPTGWIDLADPLDGEIGDKCAGAPFGQVALSTGSYEMQSLWSNATYAALGSGCTMGWPDNVTFGTLGSQSTVVHAGVNFPVQATSSSGYPVSFRAGNLPTQPEQLSREWRKWAKAKRRLD